MSSARILEAAIPFSREFFNSGDRTEVSPFVYRFLSSEPLGCASLAHLRVCLEHLWSVSVYLSPTWDSKLPLKQALAWGGISNFSYIELKYPLPMPSPGMRALKDLKTHMGLFLYLSFQLNFAFSCHSHPLGFVLGHTGFFLLSFLGCSPDYQRPPEVSWVF